MARDKFGFFKKVVNRYDTIVGKAFEPIDDCGEDIEDAWDDVHASVKCLTIPFWLPVFIASRVVLIACCVPVIPVALAIESTKSIAKRVDCRKVDVESNEGQDEFDDKNTVRPPKP